ncbi:MAG: hypothetical protein HQL28_04555 [Candidatus Omnitrophica bacterium]|nr:hypothetical protein [Candidatus Omnitrophota bacterium]
MPAIPNIIADIIFGSIGFIAFVYGKKNGLWRTMFIGFLLMVYPYFLTNPLGIYAIGVILTAVLFIWRE